MSVDGVEEENTAIIILHEKTTKQKHQQQQNCNLLHMECHRRKTSSVGEFRSL